MICGYFSCTSQKRNLLKPFELYLQIVLIHFGMDVLFSVYGAVRGTSAFSLRSFLINFVLSDLVLSNYFIVLYIVLYFVSPYINVVLKKLDEAQWKRLLLILLLIFSVYAVFVDVYTEFMDSERMGMSPITAWGNRQGFNIVNFVVMYIIGAFVRLQNPLKKMKSGYILWMLLADVTSIRSLRLMLY